MNLKILIFSVVLGVVFWSCNEPRDRNLDFSFAPSLQYESPLVGALYSRCDSVPFEFNQKMAKAGNAYQNNQSDVESLIWYGRRLGYVGKMKEAIEIYTRALKLKPEEPRLYRHRGHRYISVRNFDAAIADLEKAATLTHGKEDRIEQDGLPNDRNIPLTTLRGNIWYHLGLAYYLKGDLDNALRCYTKRAGNHSYDDNVVSTAHWKYMIMRKLNMDQEAEKALIGIDEEMDIIENDSYHQLCLFYKEAIPQHQLMINSLSGSSSDAVVYGWGNWHLYEKDDPEAAKIIFEELLKNGNPFSFGYIAAEMELKALQ